MHSIGHILTILIIQPIFNLLVLIEAILPGHSFGLAIIVFTVLMRWAMWPLVKKQLHHTKTMQKLQPELKRVKASAAGDRQKESRLIMELYKERGINPFASLGTVLLQLPIFIGLYLGVRKIATNPEEIVNFSYSWLHSFSWIKDLTANINHFDGTFLGIDLIRHPAGAGGTYVPGVLIALLAGMAQFFQSRQLMPQPADKRSLKSILGDANRGKATEQQEVNAAAQRTMIYFIPVMVFLFAMSFPTALPLYWTINSGVAYFQQDKVLTTDEDEMQVVATQPTKKASKGRRKTRRNRRR